MDTIKEPPRTPPAALRRALLVESGHRCAIPTCKSTSILEFAHIVPWAEAKEHTFENMIVLCAMCHGLYDREKKIDRKAMLAYKENLGLLRSRYSDAERRVLETFVVDPGPPNMQNSLPIPGGTSYTMLYLVRDGLVTVTPNSGISIGGLPPYELVRLTAKGVDAVNRMRDASTLDEAISDLT